MIFCFSHANCEEARARNVFPACAQFSLFCLALFAFKSRLALLLLLFVLFSPCRRQLCSRNFLFLLSRVEASYINSPTQRVSYGNELYNKFKISHGFPNVLAFSLNEAACNCCCSARALQGNSGKYRLKCGICAEMKNIELHANWSDFSWEVGRSFKGSRNERVSLHKFASTLRLRNILKWNEISAEWISCLFISEHITDCFNIASLKMQPKIRNFF